MGVDTVLQQVSDAAGQQSTGGGTHGVTQVPPRREQRRGSFTNEQSAQQPRQQVAPVRSPQMVVNGVVLDTQSLIFYGVVLADILLLLLIWMGA